MPYSLPNHFDQNRARSTNGRHIGVATAIRQAMSNGEEWTVDRLCEHFPEFTRKQVAMAICQLQKNQGGLVRSGPWRKAVYQIFSPVSVDPATTSRRMLEWRPLKRDPFEVMRLAMLTRRA